MAQHNHRYYMQTVKKEFEPVDTQAPDSTEQLYRLIEYAYLMCTDPECSHVKKEIVKGRVDDDER